MNSSRRAFTLVEIVIILAVASLLAAILFPVVSSARGSARASTCAANLRQIGQALFLYVSDHDGFYPPAVTMKSPDASGDNKKIASVWWDNIGLNPPPVCPEVDLDSISTQAQHRHLWGSYASNLYLTSSLGSYDKPILSGKMEFRLIHPSSTVVALDARPLFDAMVSPDTARTVGELKGVLYAKNWKNRILKLPLGATRHQGGANYLFGDGHVKWFRPEQLSTTRQNDGVHPGFGL